MPRGVVNLVHGDREPVEALLAHPLVDAVQLRRLRGRRAPRLRDRRGRGQARPGAGRREEPPDRHGRRGPRPDGAGGPRLRLRQRGPAMPRGQRRRRRRRGGRPARRPALREAAAALRLGPGTDPTRQLGPVIRAPRASPSCPTRSPRGRRRARRSSSTAASASRDEGFFLGATLFDHVTESMELWAARAVRPGALRRPRRHARRGARAPQRLALRQRRLDLHALGRGGADVQAPRGGRHARRQRRRRRARCRSSRSAGGRSRSSATCTRPGPTASASTRGPRW